VKHKQKLDQNKVQTVTYITKRLILTNIFVHRRTFFFFYFELSFENTLKRSYLAKVVNGTDKNFKIKQIL